MSTRPASANATTSGGDARDEARAWGAALTLVLLVLILNVGARLLARLFQPKAR